MLFTRPAEDAFTDETGEIKITREIERVYRRYVKERIPLTFWHRRLRYPLERVRKRHRGLLFGLVYYPYECSIILLLAPFYGFRRVRWMCWAELGECGTANMASQKRHALTLSTGRPSGQATPAHTPGLPNYDPVIDLHRDFSTGASSSARHSIRYWIKSPADVEIVVVDGASGDGTAELVTGYVATHDSIRYIREFANSGVDKDYDKAMSYARGKYCWLMCDDDIIIEGGVRRVYDILDCDNPDLLVVDAEIRDITLSTPLERQRLNFRGKRKYGKREQRCVHV